MERIGLDLDDGAGGSTSADGTGSAAQNPAEARCLSIQRCIQVNLAGIELIVLYPGKPGLRSLSVHQAMYPGKPGLRSLSVHPAMYPGKPGRGSLSVHPAMYPGKPGLDPQYAASRHTTPQSTTLGLHPVIHVPNYMDHYSFTDP